MTLYDKFKRLAVQADSIEDFCYKYHRREAFHDRGEEYMKFDIEDHKKEFETYGYTIIPHGSSTTGDVVAYYGKEKEK